MKSLLLFLLPLFLPFSLFGEASYEAEVTTIVDLMAATKRNLQEQEKLLNNLKEFNKRREAFLQDPDSAKFATALVRSAVKLHESIEKTHLSYLFSSDLLTEVQFFKSVAKKA